MLAILAHFSISFPATNKNAMATTRSGERKSEKQQLERKKSIGREPGLKSWKYKSNDNTREGEEM